MRIRIESRPPKMIAFLPERPEYNATADRSEVAVVSILLRLGILKYEDAGPNPNRVLGDYVLEVPK